jgi:hypothetical protein
LNHLDYWNRSQAGARVRKPDTTGFSRVVFQFNLESKTVGILDTTDFINPQSLIGSREKPL